MAASDEQTQMLDASAVCAIRRQTMREAANTRLMAPLGHAARSASMSGSAVWHLRGEGSEAGVGEGRRGRGHARGLGAGGPHNLRRK